MTQAIESLGLTAADHIRALYAHGESQFFNYALLNNAPAPEDLRTRYAQEAQEPIVIDIDRIRALGVKSILGNYLDVYRRSEDGIAVVRHNTQRVAEDLIKIGTEAKRAAKA